MNISKLAKGLALAVLVSIAAAAPATARGGKGHRGGKDMIERIISRLDLTQDQVTRIKAIRESFKSQNATLIAEVKQIHEQAAAARKAGDKERAMEIRASAKPKMEQLKAAREQMKEQVLAVLTAEQRAELEKMKSERKEKKGGRRGGRANAEKQGDARID